MNLSYSRFILLLVNKILQCLFMPEHVGMEEALELLKKPRMGNVMLAFKRAKYMPEVNHEGPHAKKKREEKEHEGTCELTVH